MSVIFPGLCVLGPYIQQSRKSERPCFGTVIPFVSASVVADFEVVRSRVSKSALGIVPGSTDIKRIPLDQVVKVVTSMDEEISSCWCHRPAVSCIIGNDCECDSENLSKGPV